MSIVGPGRIGRSTALAFEAKMALLKQFPGLVVEEMDEEILLYRPTTHQAIHLNTMAAAIWKLCDGTRTAKDLIDCFLAAYPDSQSSIPHEVQRTIDELLRDGALIEQSSDST